MGYKDFIKERKLVVAFLLNVQYISKHRPTEHPLDDALNRSTTYPEKFLTASPQP